MKKIILVCCVFIAGTTTSIAQCDTPVILSASKTEYLDSKGMVQKTVDENTVIEINKLQIVIAPGSMDHKMTGTIKADTCQWKVPFKEGKSTIHASFSNDNGETNNATIQIEGKDNKLFLLMRMKEIPDRMIRVTIDSFQQKK